MCFMSIDQCSWMFIQSLDSYKFLLRPFQNFLKSDVRDWNHQKSVHHLWFIDEHKFCGFGATWCWVNDDRFSIYSNFGRTIVWLDDWDDGDMCDILQHIFQWYLSSNWDIVLHTLISTPSDDNVRQSGQRRSIPSQFGIIWSHSMPM